MTRSLGCLLLLAACRPEPAATPRAPVIASRPFAEGFAVLDSVTLAQPDSAPIARVSGVAMLAGGRIAIADASEGNVKLYDRAGRLLRVLGRKGSGPREFQTPRYMQVGADGALHVFDPQLVRVTVIGADGTFLRTLQPDSVGYPTDFALLGDGGYTFANPDRREDGMVTVHDSLGRLRRRLVRDVALPIPEPRHPAWRTILSVWLATRGDTVLVLCTPCDQVQRQPVSGAAATSESLGFAEQRRPQLPGAAVRSAADIPAWVSGFHLSSLLRTSSTLEFANFVRGVLNYGDPNVLLVRKVGSEWAAYHDAPPVLAAQGDTLVALAVTPRDSLAAVTLRRYLLRP